MRIAPMAIWSSNLSQQDILKAVTHEVRMTHPSHVVQEANFLYCLAIQYLIKNRDSKTRCQDAFNMVMEVAKQKDLCTWEDGQCQVHEWLMESQTLKQQGNIMNFDCIENMGWIRIAFILCFYWLQSFDPS